VTGAGANGAPPGSLSWFQARIAMARPEGAPLDVAIVFGELVARAAELDPLGPDFQAVRELVRGAGAHIMDWTRAVKRARAERDLVPALARRRQAVEEDAEAEPETPAQPGAPTRLRIEALDVASRLIYDDQGKPVSQVANAITILKNDEQWSSVLAFDTFRQQVVFRRQPSWFADDAPARPSEVLDDECEVRMSAWMFRRYRLNVQKDTAGQAAHIVAKGNAYDSLVCFLDELEWDGQPRLDTWLSVYCGAPDTPYTRAVAVWFPVSMMARGYEPGKQVDHALILEGEQSEGKTSAVRALCGSLNGQSLYSESPVDMSSKDKYINLRGIWVQSFDELAGLLRSENETAKNFITATHDTYRPPWGKHAVQVLRRNVFAGTVNPGGGGYLKDPTGNRRYWPIPCGLTHPMRVADLAADRLQLLAEARDRYRAGALWYPATEEERSMCREEQSRRQEEAPWTEMIGQWLSGQPVACRRCNGTGAIAGHDCAACRAMGKVAPFKPPVDSRGRRHVTQADVLTLCLQLPLEQHARATTGVANALSALGWKRPPGQHRVRRGAVRVTAYYHPDDLEAEPERAAIEGREAFDE
jgi:predicted P-loop ATPase